MTVRVTVKNLRMTMHHVYRLGHGILTCSGEGSSVSYSDRPISDHNFLLHDTSYSTFGRGDIPDL